MTQRTDLLPRAQAAKYLGVSVSWLQAHMTDGPTATRMGRKVFYLQADLDAYIASRRGRGMTQAIAVREVRKAAKAQEPKATRAKAAKASIKTAKEETRATKASTKSVKVPTQAKASTKSIKAATEATKAVTRSVKAPTGAHPVRTPSGSHPVRTPPGSHKAIASSRPVGTSTLQQLLESVRDMAPIGKAIASTKPPPLPKRRTEPAKPPALPSRAPRRP